VLHLTDVMILHYFGLIS